jgi:hypothetical protein
MVRVNLMVARLKDGMLLLAIGCAIAVFYTRSRAEVENTEGGKRTVNRLEIGLPFSPWYASESTTSEAGTSSITSKSLYTWSGALGLIALVLFASAWPRRATSPPYADARRVVRSVAADTNIHS